MKKNRAFLKWAGGKYSLIEPISARLPQGKKLIEPFVGAGSVFLNTDYDSYLLNDINQDLITLYQFVKRRPKTFIQDARKLFVDRNNQPDAYYALRAAFNASSDPYYRSLLFLYMNRHGYNGLCRYNSKGIFNVPFGDYRKPYFPEKELEHFAEKARKAKFICRPFEQVFRRARQGDVIYCDPPYAPLVQASNFTSYATGGFGLTDQHELARRAAQVAKKRDIPVLISNHDTELTRALYKQADISSLSVSRSISQKGDGRKPVTELLALYNTEPATSNVVSLNKTLKKVGT
ncbi:Dam family site-specific DNA-(adenine-N6)-methyltransferase [Idiomarina piscisalsi]|jgi:DNA adenine methylase|uniref:Site-specific DNA-methyltransferase (adenine-specific) n=1 Tax=Idiomarina piscisalsi TaxID=1096243 RepID=A0ABM6LQH7_9GAMM|nr:Dam family site-specific DNA-(adenine-N6)-methyltransferase [Idiomarina piscisalsi]ASG64760.1 DNA adenine methylase [Idiomarina piscisalsi]MTJ00895.1 Dam family site-specific DNA-(adenine-N6)-methyltransferase [Idiomarina piscisalsi]